MDKNHRNAAGSAVQCSINNSRRRLLGAAAAAMATRDVFALGSEEDGAKVMKDRAR